MYTPTSTEWMCWSRLKIQNVWGPGGTGRGFCYDNSIIQWNSFLSVELKGSFEVKLWKSMPLSYPEQPDYLPYSIVIVNTGRDYLGGGDRVNAWLPKPRYHYFVNNLTCTCMCHWHVPIQSQIESQSVVIVLSKIQWSQPSLGLKPAMLTTFCKSSLCSSTKNTFLCWLLVD